MVKIYLGRLSFIHTADKNRQMCPVHVTVHLCVCVCLCLCVLRLSWADFSEGVAPRSDVAGGGGILNRGEVI